jgi:hypothetical protein
VAAKVQQAAVVAEPRQPLPAVEPQQEAMAVAATTAEAVTHSRPCRRL